MIDQSKYEALKLDETNHILTITLSNPGKKNAMSGGMHRELERIFLDAWEDEDVRVIVLTGEGDAFCSGADLSGMARRPADAPRRHAAGGMAKRLFYSMLDCEKPIIAKVRGPAYGLGVNVALSADVVFAAEGARFCDSHVKTGIAPGDGGAVLWPLLIGFHRAKEYLMTGDPVYAEQAAEIGLINHCVPDAELDKRVQEFAEKLVKGAPLAITYAKASVNALFKQLVSGAFEASVAYDVLTLQSEDVREGAKAFVEKRPPVFRGV